MRAHAQGAILTSSRSVHAQTFRCLARSEMYIIPIPTDNNFVKPTFYNNYSLKVYIQLSAHKRILTLGRPCVTTMSDIIISWALVLAWPSAYYKVGEGADCFQL